MVLGGSYGLSLPLWGFLCDLKVSPLVMSDMPREQSKCRTEDFIVLQVFKNSSKLVMGTGAVLIALGFLIMGQCIIIHTGQSCLKYLYDQSVQHGVQCSPCRSLQMVTLREVHYLHHLWDDSPWLRPRCLSCWRFLRCSQVCGEF